MPIPQHLKLPLFKMFANHIRVEGKKFEETVWVLRTKSNSAESETFSIPQLTETGPVSVGRSTQPTTELDDANVVGENI